MHSDPTTQPPAAPRDLPRPPVALLDGAALFLDFDGTLVDLVDDPATVTADAALRALLERLIRRHQSRVVIVSGRSIAQLDSMLGPLSSTLALCGSHGAEQRWNGALTHPEPPAGLGEAAARFRDLAALYPGAVVEVKTFGVGVHYRRVPSMERAARTAAQDIARDLGLLVQPGKMMVELRAPGSDKGAALREMMQRPEIAGARPLFVGDDATDEPAFAAARALGGAGVLVGAPRATAATHALPDTAAVRAWLAEGVS